LGPVRHRYKQTNDARYDPIVSPYACLEGKYIQKKEKSYEHDSGMGIGNAIFAGQNESNDSRR
jgi:hypothetical protein